MEQMLGGPFDESGRVRRDRSGRRIVHMLEDRVEHRPGVFGQIGHELTEFAVEVAQEQQCLVAQNREARVVNRADRVLCLKEARHQWRKFFRDRLCIGGRLQRKAECKVALAHNVISFEIAVVIKSLAGLAHTLGVPERGREMSAKHKRATAKGRLNLRQTVRRPSKKPPTGCK